MNREEAIALMGQGYCVQYAPYSPPGIIRWVDRDGQPWKKDSPGVAVRSALSNLVHAGYERLPFTHEDALRWVSQGGWLTFGPSSLATASEMSRRFRYESGAWERRLGGTDDVWKTFIGGIQLTPDYYVPIDPEGSVDPTPPTKVHTRFDIIEEFT